jgi:hypothetical protein
MAFYEDEVYYILSQELSRDRIVRGIACLPDYPGIGVLAEVDGGDVFRANADLVVQDLERLVSGLVALVVSAWDGEGYIFWQPLAAPAIDNG